MIETCDSKRRIGLGFCRSCVPKELSTQTRNCDNCLKVRVALKKPNAMNNSKETEKK